MAHSADQIEYFSYDGDSSNGIAPHAPTVGNLGGSSKVNDNLPPDPQEMPDARDHNQIAPCIAAHGRVTPALELSFRYVDNEATLQGFGAKPEKVLYSDLTITTLATGHVRVTWPEQSFPQSSLWPRGLTINSDTPCNELRAYPYSAGNGIEVKTFHDGSGVEVPFSVSVMGQNG